MDGRRGSKRAIAMGSTCRMAPIANRHRPGGAQCINEPSKHQGRPRELASCATTSNQSGNAEIP